MIRLVIAAPLLAFLALGPTVQAETITLTLDDVTVGDCQVPLSCMPPT